MLTLILLTIHLALVRENYFPSATRWVGLEGLLESLLYVGRPYSLSILVTLVVTTRRVRLVLYRLRKCEVNFID